MGGGEREREMKNMKCLARVGLTVYGGAKYGLLLVDFSVISALRYVGYRDSLASFKLVRRLRAARCRLPHCYKLANSVLSK